MAEVNRSTLKSYFQTGDTPSQAEFENFIDSVLNFQNDTPSGLVTGGDANFFIEIPANKMLERIIVHSASITSDAIRVGDTQGSTEYAEENIDTPNEPLIIDLFIYAITQRTVWVRIAENCTYKYYIR